MRGGKLVSAKQAHHRAGSADYFVAEGRAKTVRGLETVDVDREALVAGARGSAHSGVREEPGHRVAVGGELLLAIEAPVGLGERSVRRDVVRVARKRRRRGAPLSGNAFRTRAARRANTQLLLELLRGRVRLARLFPGVACLRGDLEAAELGRQVPRRLLGDAVRALGRDHARAKVSAHLGDVRVGRSERARLHAVQELALVVSELIVCELHALNGEVREDGRGVFVLGVESLETAFVRHAGVRVVEVLADLLERREAVEALANGVLHLEWRLEYRAARVRNSRRRGA